MWHMHDGWGWWMAVGSVWMVIFWGLIIWAVYAVVTRLDRGRDRGVPPAPTALEILQRRYAQSEITHEEFERTRETLMRGPGAPMA